MSTDTETTTPVGPDGPSPEVERRLDHLLLNPPGCGCEAIEVALDESGAKVWSTFRVAHTCPGAEAVSLSGPPARDAYAVRVDDLDYLHALGNRADLDLDPPFDDEDRAEALDRYAMAVHGRLVCELPRAQRESVPERYAATQIAYAQRQAEAEHVHREVHSCPCTVGAVLRDDGTPDYDHLFRWRAESCTKHAGEDESA